MQIHSSRRRVLHPIIRADFLPHYNLCDNPRQSKLIDNVNNIKKICKLIDAFRDLRYKLKEITQEMT